MATRLQELLNTLEFFRNVYNRGVRKEHEVNTHGIWYIFGFKAGSFLFDLERRRYRGQDG
jgi:hypothetical protein